MGKSASPPFKAVANGIERAKLLRPIDDPCATVFFEDVGCVQILLREILQKRDIRIAEPTTQVTKANILGRSGRMDIVAYDDALGVYNLEIQRTREGAVVDRAFFNYALLTQRAVDKGIEFKDFPYTNIAFVLEEDFFKANQPTAKVLFVLEGKEPRVMESKLNIVYVNANYQDKNTALGRMMHDMFCANADEMLTPEFAERMRAVKDPNGKEMREMSGYLARWAEEDREAGRQEGLQEGIQKGEQNMLMKIAVNFLRKGKSVSTVVRDLELSEEQKDLLMEELPRIRAQMAR